MERGLREARDAIARAQGVVVLTGAGVSADSGIPTFRAPNGLWGRYRPEELATPQAFQRDPQMVWEWYAWRRSTVRGCSPNAGHRAIAELMLARKDVTLVTQNVDGLHARSLEEVSGQAAAWASEPEAFHARILELHGNLMRSRCRSCGHMSSEESEDSSVGASPPRCDGCGDLLRPDVVWFGEALDATVLERAYQAAATADVCVVAGTSAVVHPAASIPLATHDRGGVLIEVNPDITPLSELCDIQLRGRGVEILPRILAADHA